MNRFDRDYCLAEIMPLALNSYATDEAVVPGWTRVAAIEPNGFGFVSQRGATVCVAFRGTETALDWIDDIEANPTPCYFWPQVIVHAGFQGAYLALRDNLKAVLAKLVFTELWIVGHSLGGALAQFLAADLRKGRVWTFASPRAGKADFAAGLDRDVEMYRIANTRYDLVTHAPATAWGYAEAGEAVVVNHKPTIAECILVGGVLAPFKVAHSLIYSYKPGLEAWTGQDGGLK